MLDQRADQYGVVGLRIVDDELLAALAQSRDLVTDEGNLDDTAILDVFQER